MAGKKSLLYYSKCIVPLKEKDCPSCVSETSFGKEHVQSMCPCDRVYVLSLLSTLKGSHHSLLAGKLRTGEKHDCLASLNYLISRVAL